jgi:Zn-finger nucleic acid-binding protein
MTDYRTTAGQENASNYLCPRCNAALYAGQAPDVTLYGCGLCGGIWLDNDGTRTALRGLSPDALQLLNRVTTNARSDTNRELAVACPACGKALERQTRPEAVIDICAEHGTWFDRHELYNVTRASAAAQQPLPPQPVYDYGPAFVTRTSTLAIVGFVVSFFCGLLGLILSIMGYRECESSGGAVTGKGFAVAGIIISVLGMLFGLLSALAR